MKMFCLVCASRDGIWELFGASLIGSFTFSVARSRSCKAANTRHWFYCPPVGWMHPVASEMLATTQDLDTRPTASTKICTLALFF